MRILVANVTSEGASERAALRELERFRTRLSAVRIWIARREGDGGSCVGEGGVEELVSLE